MKLVLVLLFSLLTTTLSHPRVKNDLTCPICLDVVTDIDEFLTDATTVEEVIEFAKQLCAALGLILADMETECNKIMEEQLPAIIDELVNGQLEPQAVCQSIGACP
eukprot:TRINITY_DN15949_c0_g1_i1.p2 TRINITY_DN15949_c0_g1~~TRINITY_DN15949_c0_g1_i1.p2  ORF type:complete len:106 (-),score=51.58 TRINITY_DN15949_c0_g1_i1:15-332(-)